MDFLFHKHTSDNQGKLVLRVMKKKIVHKIPCLEFVEGGTRHFW